MSLRVVRAELIRLPRSIELAGLQGVTCASLLVLLVEWCQWD